MTWEVASVREPSSRVVLRRDVASHELWAYVAAAFEEGGGVMVTRSDQTPEALFAQWERDFYDRDKRGYKRRRYKKSQTEKEWEDVWKRIRKDTKDAATEQKQLGDTETCVHCGSRWSRKADTYGFAHVCGVGLINGEEKQWTLQTSASLLWAWQLVDW